MKKYLCLWITGRGECDRNDIVSYLTGIALFFAVLEAYTTVYAVLALNKVALMPFIQLLISHLGWLSLIPLVFLRSILVLLSPLELKIGLILFWGWWSWRNMF